jgi:predicted GNAT family acetyltransferase
MIIRHNPALNRFETGAEPELAHCDYERRGAVWVLPHTFVPESMRGGGVAAALVKATMEHVRAEGGRIVPVCSYVAAYLSRHPEYASLALET